VLLVVGYWASRVLEQRLQTKDAAEIVIDEVLGIGIALAFTDFSWFQMVLAFVFFRLFDITKPSGVKFFDRHYLKGWGVILDDLVAGLYAAAIMFALNYSGILSLLEQ